MAFKLEITKHANELLDNLVFHLIFRLKNEKAAIHLLEEIDHIYDRLEDNPAQFPISRDEYLAAKGYHDAFLPDMNYVVVFEFDENTVRVMGIFHELENYERKL